MPVQALIRHLSRAQVEKAIVDKNMQGRLLLQDSGGSLLLVVEAQNEAGDKDANLVLQSIADADSAITQKEAEASEKTKKSGKP